MSQRILTFLLLLCMAPAFGQLEASRWYFGDFAGLDFNNGCPDPLIDSAIETIEASSVTSDSSGNLLFYTDGETLYNRNHVIMNNGEGLLGHKSSTNGALSVPFVNDPNRYYLFTADAVQYYQETGGGAGFNYSEINMTAGGGLGAVINKNINLLPESSEKLTGIAIDNGYWVLTHSGENFYAYEITEAGIQDPVISIFSPDIDNENNIRGSLKISPDGSKVAIAHVYTEPSLEGQVWLYNFDINTGQLSSPLLLGNDILYYGVEFSPNSEVLYVDGKAIIDGGQNTGAASLFQFDLTASDIVSSRYLVATYDSTPLVNLAGALQVSIDTKIYQTLGGVKLSAISKPNRLGALCNFGFRQVGLSGRNTSLGLPISLQSYYDNIVEYDNLCFEDQTQFRIRTSRGVSSITWNFGDPASGSNNTSIFPNPIHIFSSAGSYTVLTEVTFNDGEVLTYETIVKVIMSAPADGATLTQCDIDTNNTDGLTQFNLFDIAEVIFDSDDPDEITSNLIFYESEQDAEQFINPIQNVEFYENTSNGQVIYASIFRSLDCFRIVPITLLAVAPEIPPDLYYDICAIETTESTFTIRTLPIRNFLENIYPNQQIQLYASFQNAGAQSSSLGMTNVLSVNSPLGLYYRVGAGSDCVIIGFVSLDISPPLELDRQTIELCSSNNEVELNAPENILSYLWSTGETTNSIVVTEPGIYTVDVFESESCSGQQVFEVVEGSSLIATVTSIDFQQDNQILINAESTSDIIYYSIDGGATYGTDSAFKNLAPGVYEVAVTNPDFCLIIRETITLRGAPRYFTPNNDGFNDRWHVKNVQDYPGIKINIFDRFGKQITTLTNRTQGWDGTYNGKKQGTNTYWYSIEYEDRITYGYFTLITRERL